MNKTYLKLIAFFFTGIAVVSCDNDFENSVEDGDLYTSGSADFSKYVTIGNSLTAGFADNALYIQGQQNSYPNIIAQQMELVGGGEFNQPLVNDNLGGLTAGGTQIAPNRSVLAVGANGNPGPATLAGTPTTDITNKVTGPLNNFGVPGARVFHLGAPGYGSLAGVSAGTANPYYARFSSSENSTVIADAAAANGTFFTLWIGNNDILGYATSGGVGVDNNETGETNPALQGDNSITNIGTFNVVYRQLVDAMTANGAKGALVNIPDVTSIPFFTTVPSLALSPIDPNFAPQIPLLNQFYGGLNQIFAAFGQSNRQIQFSTTAANGLVIRDDELADLSANPAFVNALIPLLQGVGAATGTQLSTAQAAGLAQILAPQFGQIRQATSDDLVTLTASPLLGGNNQTLFSTLTSAGLPATLASALSANGVTFPLSDVFVLTDAEQDAVASAQTAYNAIIAAVASEKDLALVDARSALADVADGGIAFNGGVLTSAYVTGGAFSLDGVHPTSRGYAYTANVIIEAINDKYGSTLPTVDIGQYPSVLLSNDVQ